MIDPYIVSFVAAFGLICIVCLFSKQWFGAIVSPFIVAAFLLGITYSAGYPTNASFPSHAIVYGLTADHVWAAPKDDPYPPRSYIFKAPSSWFEERDKRKGQPFEVQKQEGVPQGEPGANPSDRTSEGPYVIHQHVLPPKEG